MPGLDLDRPRDLSAIVSTAFSTWWHHLGVFIALAAIPVFLTTFLVDGLWIGHLEDPDTTGPVAALIAQQLIGVLIVAPVVTAMHVLVVMGLARGEEPALGEALRSGVRVLPQTMVAVALYVIAVILGYIALIIPGVWLSVLLVFSAQAAVVDDARGLAALRRSRELVRGNWWRTFGILIVLSLLAGLLAVPLGFVTQIIGSAAGNGPLYVLGSAIAQTVTSSFLALAGTVLFFDLRTRRSAPVPAWTSPEPGLAAPERPF